MPILELEALDAKPLTADPYDHVVAPDFIREEWLPELLADFPRVEQPGSFPAGALSFGPAFGALLEELRSEQTTRSFARKFGIDLSGRPTMVSVRGQCRAGDGGIHTDSATKVVTALIYFNPGWTAETGRLRLLRSGDDIGDHAVEIAPEAGTLVAFRRSDRSFHGHLPYVGERRSVQLNWVTTAGVARREMIRHGIAARLKSLLAT